MELTIRQAAQVKPVFRRAYDAAMAAAAAGIEKVLVLRDPKRTDAQNKLLHALLGEVSKRVEWAGAKRDITTWKRLMVAAWLRAEGESPDVLPALDGKGIEVIYEPTSSMGKGQLISLIEYVYAWMSEHCPIVEIVDAETGEILSYADATVMRPRKAIAA